MPAPIDRTLRNPAPEFLVKQSADNLCPHPASEPDSSDRVRFVLVRTSHPGNIGSAARAIRTMSCRRLDLVAPHKFPDAQASAMAAGADDVLDAAAINDTLVPAVADCRLVLGCSARRRGIALEELTPREAAARALLASRDGPVAFVFGNERTGLENDELMTCHAMVRIPSAEDFPSLNLAQAVQVLAYEWRMATLSTERAQQHPARKEPLADADQLEHFFGHLAATLDAIDFHKGRSPRKIMQRLRRLFLRCELEQREVRILRGIFDDAQRVARRPKPLE